MRISAISQVNLHNIYNGNLTNRTSVKFTAHPDFYKLPDVFPGHNCMASSYFRRGKYYGKPSVSYQDVIDTYKQVYANNEQKSKKILFVGVADCQEIFSHLATIKDLTNGKPIEDSVDMNIVDLQSKLDYLHIYKNSYYDQDYIPKFAQSSFDEVHFPGSATTHYRVKGDIYSYVNYTCENPSKAFWETRIQDATKKFKKNSFDVISINNVIPYITSQKEIDKTVKNLFRILKPGGYLIADPKIYGYSIDSKEFGRFEEIFDGIYRKPLK